MRSPLPDRISYRWATRWSSPLIGVVMLGVWIGLTLLLAHLIRLVIG